MNFWTVIRKGDARGRVLADRHYTREKVGDPKWTRPGYNYCLYYQESAGKSAVFVWWRPKWSAGQERFDGLRVVECTIFRNETSARSSILIAQAVEALSWPEASVELCLDRPLRWPLVTGVSGAKTSRRRSKRHAAGWCFRVAGWSDFPHKKGRADTWLKLDP